MTSTGRVVSVNNNIATVQVVKTSACGHNCSECAVCNAPVIQTEAVNNIGAKPGDRVVIETKSSGILKLAFILYMLPVLVVIAIGIISVITHLKNVIIAIICLTAFIIWCIVLRLLNIKSTQNNIIVQVILQ